MFPALRTHLARCLFPYGSVRKVLAGPLRGARFRVAPGMGISYALGRDHGGALRFLAARLVPGQRVYDVGANQGQFSLLFGRMAGAAAVLALEPVAENVAALRANLVLNGLEAVQIQQAAAGRRAGVERFAYAEGSRTMGAFAHRAFKLPSDTPCVEVDTLRLDDLPGAGVPPPVLIKIDVEGAAGDVLDGAVHLLQQHRPRLFIELHLSAGQRFEHDAVSRLITQHGYHVEMLDGLPLDAARPDGEYHAWCVAGG
jgi:FkbM family methyltransferase